MTSLRSFQQKLASVHRHWEAEQYDAALKGVEDMQQAWPGNAQLPLLWSSLVQLQESPAHDLKEVKKSLQRAIVLDKNAPAGSIEFGHYLDAVEDDPEAASKAFAEGAASARRLLIDALLGQAKSLVQIDQRDNALKCLMEALYLTNQESIPEGGNSEESEPNLLLRDPAGSMLVFQIKGPFAIKIEELIQELFPKRSA